MVTRGVCWESFANRGAARWLAVPVLLLGTLPAVAAGADANDLIGTMTLYITSQEETLLEVAEDNNLGFLELVAANQGIDPWLPGDGTIVLLPTAHLLPSDVRDGIVINLADMRLYYFPEGAAPRSYPIGIGRDGWDTPVGITEIVAKRENPTWVPTATMRAARPDLPDSVGPGPDNPLGLHAMNMGWPHYVIHGTNKPRGIGRRVSSGCIRLYPQDIAELFAAVPIGTPVTVVNEQAKVGRVGDALFLEVHPNLEQADRLEESGRFELESVPGLHSHIASAADGIAAAIDWRLVQRAIDERRGIPIRITR